MYPVVSGHWKNVEDWGTFVSGLFSPKSQDLKEMHRTTQLKAIREARVPHGGCDSVFCILFTNSQGYFGTPPPVRYVSPSSLPASEVTQSLFGLCNIFIKS